MTSQPRGASPSAVRVGDYTLLSRIGEGGMGVVHLARRPGGERVALKVLRPHIVGDEEARRRLAREVGSLRRIRSRWVAEIVDADPWAPVPYVATRYVPGLSLHDHVADEGPIEGADLLWFAGSLAEGLDSVHAAGVLHRDVKPSNVLMEGRTPILIDFGLARVADDPKLTHTGWLLGTPGYLAPEILYGDDATAASDVHSWGATVAYAATGKPPFGRGPSMAIMDRVRRGEFDLSGMQGALRDVVAATLEPDPERRPTLEAILAWLRPQTTRPQPVLGAPPLGQPGAAGPVDPFDAPLLLAAQAHGDPAPAGPPGSNGEEVFDQEAYQDDVVTAAAPTLVEPQPLAASRTRSFSVPPPVAPVAAAAWPGQPPFASAWPVEPEPESVAFSERARRLALLLASALVVGACCAAAPWVTLAVVLVGVWLVRSGSLAASGVGDRRRVRGRKWYDAPQLLIHAPWHVVQSIPATAMLVLWAAGLAASAALICYAASAGIGLTLFVMGLTLSASLWWGPGGSRVRGPLRRVAHPAARQVGRWTLVLVALLVVTVLVGLVQEARGVEWAPASGRPFS